MWVFTRVADWIDEQGKSADSVLDQLVEDSHYNHGVMIAAATTHSFMKFGASMSDILRLGDGVKKGGVSGFFADGMRFIAIFPVGKATQMAKSAVLLRERRSSKTLRQEQEFSVGWVRPRHWHKPGIRPTENSMHMWPT